MVVYRIIVAGRSYVGSSKNFEQRKKEHLRDLRNNKHHSPFLQRQYNKYGNPIFEVLEEVVRIEEMHQLEEKWINKIGELNGVKSAVGGDRVSQLTGQRRERWKEKLKNRPKNHNTSCFKDLTLEEREDRLRVWSEAKRGSKNGRYIHNRNQIEQIDKKTREVIHTYKDLCEVESAGFERRNVLNCLNKKKSFNSCKGFIWRWKD
jgi:group I intron endonuclease